MAIAVTKCEVLCGFRPLQQIRHLVTTAPEFRKVVGEEHLAKFLQDADHAGEEKKAVKRLFDVLMRSDAGSIQLALQEMKQRISTHPDRTAEDVLVRRVEDLILRLDQQFPGDVGCLVVYFLNDIIMEPGQALFLGPNVPHAYIQGDMIECMAASDNTVRAGLTPKFKDVDTLVEMLTYHLGEPDWVEPKVIAGSGDGACVKVYAPPVEEFMVSCIEVSASSSEAWVEPCDSLSLLLIYQGSGEVSVSSGNNEGQEEQLRVGITQGQVYVLAAGQALKVRSVQKDHMNESLIIWKANVNCVKL